MHCHKKNHWLLFGILALIFSSIPNLGAALGFGDIKLYSYLNEPLDAEIELVGADDMDPSLLVASLASAEDFKRADMLRPYYLTQLRFHAKREKKRLFIKVTTDEATNQPFLEFLVGLAGPEGRLVKGYTLLLDPAPVGSAAVRDVEKPVPSRAHSQTIDKHAVIRMHESLANQKTDDKLANNLSRPMRLAQSDSKQELYSDAQDVERSHQADTQNLAVQPLEQLFELTDRQEVALAPISKAKPVTIDDASVANDTNAATTHALASAKASPAVSPEVTTLPLTETIASTSVTPISSAPEALDKHFKKSGETRLLLVSGFALLLVVTVTVWILRRAANRGLNRSFIQQSVAPNEEYFTYKDEMMIKLSLARRYIDIQDMDNATEVLEEILKHDNKSAQEAAHIMLAEIKLRSEVHQ